MEAEIEGSLRREDERDEEWMTLVEFNCPSPEHLLNHTIMTLPSSPPWSPPWRSSKHVGSAELPVSTEDLNHIFKSLRVLDLSGFYSIKELPKIIGECDNLRYLDITQTNIKRIPSSITKLRNVQLLLLPKCFKLETLPYHLNETVQIHVDGTTIKRKPWFELRKEIPRIAHGAAPVELEQTIINEATPGTPLNLSVPDDAVPFHEGNEDWAAASSHKKIAESYSHLNEIYFGVKSQFDLQTDTYLENPPFNQDISLCNATNFVSCETENNHHTFSVGLNDMKLPRDDGENGKKRKMEITCEAILEFIPKSMTLVDAAKELGVSRSTLKRRCRELGIEEWPSSKRRIRHCSNQRNPNTNKLTSINESSQLNLANPPNPAESLNGASQLIFSSTSLSQLTAIPVPFGMAPVDEQVTAEASSSSTDRNLVSKSTLKHSCTQVEHDSQPSIKKKSVSEFKSKPGSASKGKTVQVNSSFLASPVDHEENTQFLQDLNHHGSLSTRQDGTSNIFTVKAKYKEDIVKFDFSSTSRFAQLKEEVGKRLSMSTNSFKIKYVDDDNEVVRITCEDDLQYFLRNSGLSNCKTVRLFISDMN